MRPVPIDPDGQVAQFLPAYLVQSCSHDVCRRPMMVFACRTAISISISV